MEPNPPTGQMVKVRPRGTRTCPEPSESTHRFLPPVERGGVLPHAVWGCPHSHLAPAILCLGLWGQLQAGEELGVTLQLGAVPRAPQTTEPASLAGMEAPEPSWEGQREWGLLEGATGLPHLPSRMASVCTWTVKSCRELSWNRGADSALEEASLRPRPQPGGPAREGRRGDWRCAQPSQPLCPRRGPPAWCPTEPEHPAPRPGHCPPQRQLPGTHLFVSYFDDECFGAGQVAGLEAQAHPPQGLPAEEQQRDPGQHPDHGVIADDSPWTATVAAEPLWAEGGAGRESRAGRAGRCRPLSPVPWVTYHG